MEQIRRRDDEVEEFNLKEWSAKARLVSRENTNSRRFSASNLRSFREEHTNSFRTNFTISSTASSPGYTLREEINPTTYSFTTALRALQAKSVYSWEISTTTPDGIALHSKWSEAEKYICNPLSGEVPIECLSAKTLSGRYINIPTLAGRVTMSAPLLYSRLPHHHSKPSHLSTLESHVIPHFPIQENKVYKKTRDVGTQSTPKEMSSSSSSSLSSTHTPSIEERSIHRRSEIFEVDESSKFLDMVQSMNDGESDPSETQGITKGEENNHDDNDKQKEKRKHMPKCNQVRCISWRSLCIRGKQQNKTRK